MKSIKIITKSDKGKLALEHHIAETTKLKKRTKLAFKMLGYTQEVTNMEPYTVEITLTNKYFQHLVKASDVLAKVSEAMGENGALLERDYIYEVVE